MYLNQVSVGVVEVEPGARSTLVAAVLAAVVLGGMAFAADLTTGLVSAVLQALFSSGAAWGVAAVVLGVLAPTTRLAIGAGAGGLVGATIVYYLLILLVSRRWQGGHLEDGSSADTMGLLSIARAASFWIVAGIVVGAAFAVSGRLIAHGSARIGALVAGLVWGVLVSNGVETVLRVRGWSEDGGHFGRNLIISALLAIMVATVVLVMLCVGRGFLRYAHHVAVTAVLSCATGVVGWSAIATRSFF